ncbi:MAG TPA: flagellar motor protein MotB [Rhizomicrobium sp.]|jgi:chemotaxis protein MotB|nr:flagellar motor protein MotB [Rhizomicrobium sp.]
MASENAVVIKRIKKGGHGGHHGGAWKVAYADFVTAMMAFFLLMWLINTTTPEQKRGIADYFAPQSIAQTVSGSGGVLGGKVMGEDSAHAGGAQSVMQKQSPPSPPSDTKALASGQTQGGAGADAASTSTQSGQNGDFAHAAEAIHQAVQDNPDIANLSHQVITENTPQGLRIQLVDQDGRPMFEQGSTEPMPYTKKLLAAVGGIIASLPNRVSIAGHTAGNDQAATGGNWELSAARANQARALLQAGGLSSDRIYEVAGKAGSEPLLPEDPNASANRRLSILLMREAPPAPANTGLGN